jgi:hypothetical protein
MQREEDLLHERGRRAIAGQAVHRTEVGIADPGADDPALGVGDGPGVPEAGRRPCLHRHRERVLEGAQAVERREPGEGVGQEQRDLPGRALREETSWLRPRLVLPMTELLEPAVVGEDGIGPDEALERHRKPADPEAEAVPPGGLTALVEAQVAEERVSLVETARSRTKTAGTLRELASERGTRARGRRRRRWIRPGRSMSSTTVAGVRTLRSSASA